MAQKDLALIKPYNITVIGAGKLSWHLCQQLFAKGFTIKQVFSRQLAKAQQLAKLVEAETSNNLDEINTNVDWVIIAVSDDAIKEVSETLSTSDALFTHTSGSASIKLLSKHKNKGVFYPLQSFSKNNKPNWGAVPIFVDANQKTEILTLTQIANSISNTVIPANDTQRTYLHLAAVFANNFSNHLFHIASSILKDSDLPFSSIMPLIQETVNKLQYDEPNNLQTGPAIRGDNQTIEKQLELLEDKPSFKAIYKLLNDSIIKTKNL